MALSVCPHRVGGFPVISVAGELDVTNADQLGDAVERALDDLPSTLVVDLGDVTFIDSAGVHAVVRPRTMMVTLRTRLHVVADADQVRETFALMGLADTVPLHRTLDGALRCAAGRHPEPA
ncbi:STAS domain-containing protein [Georgenia subflava]|uniref:Anti-sigma factor antagonist n=1 Tax=Georgenia subflava TaxID=1622177 RepID=A0A6N7EK42_9MICO|nr:STAS domain-containing protein [Georgenia subflava]MPV38722.1 anti-sigma factor antagonist [Georgenia subflava]